jgi:hypothetical protein
MKTYGMAGLTLARGLNFAAEETDIGLGALMGRSAGHMYKSTSVERRHCDA